MIKRFNPDFSLSISHELAYMRETPEGGYVAHGDYATLFSELESVKAERDALAVENAALKKSLIAISLAEPIDGETIVCDFDTLVSIAAGALTTPATDAALTAIEARVWVEAKDLAKSMLATDSADHIDFLFDGKIKQLREAK
ncbi:Uncharacterised protein [Serratia liquefaciens]|uniref:hypothetical protein n=1 Tax=Serratia liquefaciens TaxID=614 RepID=UPI0021778452|nr:hypothetical protein [Serratia liquefaciens]CAI1543810.1 Uncharacterised protein [Serratia liquefaciens]